MTDDQKRLRELCDRASEQRARLSELARVDELTDDQRAELDKIQSGTPDLERQIRAARAAVEDEDDKSRTSTANEPDAEERERLQLRSKSRLGAYLLARLEGRIPSGAEAEFAAACRAKPGEIPLDLFEEDRPKAQDRADAPSGIPTTGLGQTLAPISPYVFSNSIAPRLGIAMPQVGTGAFSEATITTSTTAAPVAKGTAQESTAAVMTPVTASARRITARLSILLEDVATIGTANFESALRMNLSERLSDEYDRQCIAGNGTAPNVEGLIAQLTDPTNPTTVAEFDDFVQAFTDQIDGLWASRTNEIGIVTNPDAYKLSARTFRDVAMSDLGDKAFSDYAMAHYGGWWCNARMPATSGDIARGIVYRMGKPGLRTATHPTWGTVSITDIYSDSASGQTHFTLHVLVGDKVLIVQPAAYGLVEFKVSA